MFSDVGGFSELRNLLHEATPKVLWRAALNLFQLLSPWLSSVDNALHVGFLGRLVCCALRR